MNLPMMLVEMILAGFFAVACIRACVPANPGGKLQFSDLLRFPGRLERLSRSRWQWFSMVALLLVIRLQAGLPLAARGDRGSGIRDLSCGAGARENVAWPAKERTCGSCGKSLISFAA